MPRNYGRTRTDIWDDPAFVALGPDAQRLYLMLNSQSDLSMCGALAYTPRRWAGYSIQTEPADIHKAFGELVATSFVLFDETSEELVLPAALIEIARSRNPRWRAGARAGLAALHSYALVSELQEILPADVWGELDPVANGNRLPFDCHSIGNRMSIDSQSIQGEGGGKYNPSNALSKTQPEDMLVENIGGGGASGDIPEVVSSAIRQLAQRDLALAEARAERGMPLRDAETYLAACIGRRSLRDGALLASLAADDPDLTATRLANRLEPPEVNSPPEYEPEGTGHGVKPDMAAVRAIADGHRRRSTL